MREQLSLWQPCFDNHAKNCHRFGLLSSPTMAVFLWGHAESVNC